MSFTLLRTLPIRVAGNSNALARSFVSKAQPVRAEVNENKTIDLTPPSSKVENSFEVFEEPKRLKPTHNIPVCNLQMRGYLPQQLDFYADFAQRAAYHLGMPCTGTIRLPTQTSHWTVIRSPFVHKKSQENFERKTHKRLLQIKDAHPEVVQRWLRYLTMNAPAGIGMRATTWEFENLDAKK
ncbi:ribosomal protein S10 domain-containing protein [Phascolomyces articulosus]|uniref:Small ribosomal subunit protein uS10m n=1 Tax=Phascolomyces articulosus TaxID=60185 RepID=A0AAD5PEB6_9FUNG|nr:ribosomal protein S10 domain-containing protein [Phascolomyces articulosus]